MNKAAIIFTFIFTLVLADNLDIIKLPIGNTKHNHKEPYPNHVMD